MRRICVVLIACIMVFGLSACGSSQSGTEVESKYTADTSFLDDVYIDDYMEEDREAIQSLCMGCGQDMAQVTSEQEYERVKHSFENRLAEYDSVQALVEYYESALHGYVDNFDDSVVKKSEIYSLYDDMKDALYDAHTKADFYKACVDIDDEIEDKFGVSPRPSMDVRLYIEDRNLNDEPVFDNSGKDKEKDKDESDKDSIWPKNGAYVDYDGNTYATREEVQEAVNSGKISAYYYLYPDGRVDSTVPISDEILDKYKEKHR